MENLNTMKISRRFLLWAAATICLAASPDPSVAGDIYALSIGVDDYAHINPLQGAVNDARDLSDALASIGARDVRTLIDREATREAIFRNWHDLTAAAGEGDTLIFHYAGHGGRQDAILDKHERKDNLFLLPGFEHNGPGSRERIVDNEIGHLLSIETEATVFFVADSCFAGGMTRSADPRSAISFRTPGVEFDGVEDAVAQRVRSLGEIDDDALQHVVWVYAQDKNQVTPEIAIDGQRRGALSYAFARALRGEADRNGDGQLDVPELKRFINRTVTRLSERQQRPEVNAGSPDLLITITERGPDEQPAPVKPGGIEMPTLRMHLPNGPIPFKVHGVTEVADKLSADIVYDAVEGVLVYKTGDRVGEFDLSESPTEQAYRLQGAIEKWRLLQKLAELNSENDPELKLSDGDRVYHEGEHVEFSIKSDHHEHVVLFNLAFDGTIQVISPDEPGQPRPGLHGGKLQIGKTQKFAAAVVPPFGADHLIGLTTHSDSPELDSAVLEWNGEWLREGLAMELVSMLRKRTFGVDWVGLYTRP